MPRTARIVAPDYPFHITQRGNNRQNVFEDGKDKKIYLDLINEYSKKYDLSHLAYCLMDNHVHFISIPHNKNSLSRVFSVVNMRYSQYFNKKMDKSGHLWQGRFYSCVLGDGHLLVALRYVERNPVRAGMVKEAWNWEWSTAGEHIGKEKGLLELTDLTKTVDINLRDWKKFLDTEEKEDELNKIRTHTKLGFPLGSKEFVNELSSKTGKLLNLIPRGRPKKKSKEK